MQEVLKREKENSVRLGVELKALQQKVVKQEEELAAKNAKSKEQDRMRKRLQSQLEQRIQDGNALNAGSIIAKVCVDFKHSDFVNLCVIVNWKFQEKYSGRMMKEHCGVWYYSNADEKELTAIVREEALKYGLKLVDEAVAKGK